MAEYTANAVQTVAAGENVLFTDAPIRDIKCVQHRPGSGLVTLRGIGAQHHARFRVTFSANIAAVTNAAEITLALAINGEAVGPATMATTPAAIGTFYNVGTTIIVDVPAGCCLIVAVENTSNQAVTVRNANLIVDRIS